MDYKESIHANVEAYNDDKGAFDVMKFIKSVDVDVAQSNKTKVQHPTTIKTRRET